MASAKFALDKKYLIFLALIFSEVVIDCSSADEASATKQLDDVYDVIGPDAVIPQKTVRRQIKLDEVEVAEAEGSSIKKAPGSAAESDPIPVPEKDVKDTLEEEKTYVQDVVPFRRRRGRGKALVGAASSSEEVDKLENPGAENAEEKVHVHSAAHNAKALNSGPQEQSKPIAVIQSVQSPSESESESSQVAPGVGIDNGPSPFKAIDKIFPNPNPQFQAKEVDESVADAPASQAKEVDESVSDAHASQSQSGCSATSGGDCDGKTQVNASSKKEAEPESVAVGARTDEGSPSSGSGSGAKEDDLKLDLVSAEAVAQKSHKVIKRSARIEDANSKENEILPLPRLKMGKRSIIDPRMDVISSEVKLPARLRLKRSPKDDDNDDEAKDQWILQGDSSEARPLPRLKMGKRSIRDYDRRRVQDISSEVKLHSRLKKRSIPDVRPREAGLSDVRILPRLKMGKRSIKDDDQRRMEAKTLPRLKMGKRSIPDEDNIMPRFRLGKRSVKDSKTPVQHYLESKSERIASLASDSDSESVDRHQRNTGSKHSHLRSKFPPEFCDLERDSGVICPKQRRGPYLEQFYYEPASNRCYHFIYNGCGGNANRFSSLWECAQSCTKQQIEANPNPN